MLRDFIQGFGYGLRGLRWLGQPGLRAFVAGPVAVNIGLFIGALWLILQYMRPWLDSLTSGWPEWLSFLLPLLMAIMVLLLLVAAGFLFTACTIVLTTPLLGLLSAAVTRLKTGTPPPDEGPPWWQELFLMPLRELRRTLRVLLTVLVLCIISVIPVLNLIAPLLWALYGAWQLGLQAIDAPLANHGFNADAQAALARRHRGRILGLGAATLAAGSVPLLNLLAAPAAVTGATLLCHECWPDVLRSPPPPAAR